MDVEKLKERALRKLSMQPAKTSINVEQLRQVATKTDPLTDKDITQLTTFVTLSSIKLKNVLFYGNATVNPSNWDKKLYQKTEKQGWIEHCSTKNK
jgi:hypothetical protein